VARTNVTAMPWAR